ncbi:2664_t:CDS:1, partial [Paraglomus brasilianum]
FDVAAALYYYWITNFNHKQQNYETKGDKRGHGPNDNSCQCSISNIKSRFTHCQEQEESTRTIEDEQTLENDSNDTTTDSEDENGKKYYNDE